MNRTAPGHTSGQGHPTALRGEAKARSPIHATLQAIFGAMGRGFDPVPARGAISPSRGRSQRLLPEATPAEGERHPAASRLALGERPPAPQTRPQPLPQTRAMAQAGAKTQLPSRAQLPSPGQQPWSAQADQPTHHPHQPPVQPHADWHAYTRQRLLAAWLGRAPESGPTASGPAPSAAPAAPLSPFFPL